MTPERFRRLERETFDHTSVEPIHELSIEEGHTELPEGKKLPDAHFEHLKWPSQKTIDGLNKHFPLPSASIPKIERMKIPHKPQKWSIKNQTPKIRESDVLEMLGTEEP